MNGQKAHFVVWLALNGLDRQYHLLNVAEEQRGNETHSNNNNNKMVENMEKANGHCVYGIRRAIWIFWQIRTHAHTRNACCDRAPVEGAQWQVAILIIYYLPH